MQRPALGRRQRREGRGRGDLHLGQREGEGEKRVRERAAQGIPVTLVHNDPHGGNAAVRDGRVRFFDWSDPRVSHPFCDLVTLLPSPDGPGDDRELHQRLRERYLAGSADVAAPVRLRRAFELAWCVGALNQFISYVGILRSLERAARTELSGALSSWLRAALDRAAQVRPGRQL